ncbi:hypothetical protein VOLCADRAFT_95231 [Volvox carteri f. nagariensis]|uniref:Uncharacterized protein n=1 Tax=Volvox carteri f. nagariensis TaxID=3068 RepID=D8U6Y5_VOLCA|nr:uncharacterized protein VOLCADRAFT_95231 [Volvox carteri f. nagariensis]EFJ44518.1 hypothetical protein VOLCADRAFT_95231 [Volvox carteri f. nagariensis]|eukprot:XP_002954368.1 hypothetical protein VOLCADRAFT_95231 [Volvox carteri f. nagariensis]
MLYTVPFGEWTKADDYPKLQTACVVHECTACVVHVVYLECVAIAAVREQPAVKPRGVEGLRGGEYEASKAGQGRQHCIAVHAVDTALRYENSGTVTEAPQPQLGCSKALALRQVVALRIRIRRSASPPTCGYCTVAFIWAPSPTMSHPAAVRTTATRYISVVRTPAEAPSPLGAAVAAAVDAASATAESDGSCGASPAGHFRVAENWSARRTSIGSISVPDAVFSPLFAATAVHDTKRFKLEGFAAVAIVASGHFLPSV